MSSQPRSPEGSRESSGRMVNLVSTCVRVLALVALAAAATWIMFGRGVLEKVLSDALMPVGWIVGILVIGSVHSLRQRNRRAAVWLLIPLVILLVAGNRLVANRFVATLESRYSDVDPLQMEPLQSVVLLGGATRQTPNGATQVNRNGDRVVMTARLYHRGLVKRIYCSGSRMAGLSGSSLDEGEMSAELLKDLGVPPSAISRLEGRNTAEEMETIASTLSNQPVGIVTSAWHLPRAMRLAKSAGIDARPLPCDYLGDGASAVRRPAGAIVRDCIPGYEALAINSRVVREYMAAWVGR